MSPSPIAVRLDINRAKIGAYRAMRVFQACRAFAHSIAPGCDIAAIYENYERVGWMFTMPDPHSVDMLRAFHVEAMQRTAP